MSPSPATITSGRIVKALCIWFVAESLVWEIRFPFVDRSERAPDIESDGTHLNAIIGEFRTFCFKQMLTFVRENDKHKNGKKKPGRVASHVYIIHSWPNTSNTCGARDYRGCTQSTENANGTNLTSNADINISFGSRGKS